MTNLHLSSKGQAFREQAKEREAVVAYRDPREFIKSVIKDDQGQHIEFEDVHAAMLYHIRFCFERGIWCALYGPWEHSKTTISLGFILWLIAERGQQGYKAKIISSSAETASKRLCAIEKYIETDKDFRRIYPRITKGGKWNESRMDIQKQVISLDSTLESHGLDSKDMGSRADVEWFDDVCDAQNALGSDIVRQHTIRTYENSWISRIKTAAAKDNYNPFVLNTTNVWHEKDLTQVIKTQPRYCIIEIKVNGSITGLTVQVLNAPQDYNPPVGDRKQWDKKVFRYDLPFWSRINRAELVKKKGGMSESTFNRGYRLIPLSGDEQQFPSYDLCVEYEAPITRVLLQSMKSISIGVDLSGKKRAGVCFTVTGTDGSRKVRLMVKAGKYTSPETAHQLKLLNDTFNPTVIGVENNAYQEALVEWIKEMGKKGQPGYDFWMKVKGWTTGRNKIDEQIGLPHLETQFSNRGYRILMPFAKGDHSLACQCSYCREQTEFNTFPHTSADTVMSFWIADRMLPTGAGQSGTSVGSEGTGEKPRDRHEERQQIRGDRRPGRGGGRKRFFG